MGQTASISNPGEDAQGDDPLITEHFSSNEEELWLLPARTLVDFQELVPFSTLFSRNRLVRWKPDSKRTVVMISHQWSASGHPDPKMRQTSVLQMLFQHMASGKVAVGREESTPTAGPSTEEQKQCLEWDLWYDYCCLPQAEIAKGSTPAFMQHLFHAVNYVLVLAPPLLHVDGSIMNLHTTSSRGWCSLERMAGDLLDKPVLAVTGAKSIFRMSTKDWMQSMPHKQKFSTLSHQDVVKQLTLELLEWKCKSCVSAVESKEQWLFYTALTQRLRPAEYSRSLDSFWTRYGMNPQKLRETSTTGFSPLMLACIEANYCKVQLLLEAKACVNELRQTNLGLTSALGVATMASPAVVRCLLEAKASVEVGNPMNFAVQFSNLETLALLPSSQCYKTNPEGDAPINLAVLSQNTSMLDVLLQLGANPTQVASKTKFIAPLPLPKTSRASKISIRNSKIASIQRRSIFLSDDSSRQSSPRERRNSRTSRSSRQSTSMGSMSSDATDSQNFSRWFGRPPSPREELSDAETVDENEKEVQEDSPPIGVRFHEEKDLLPPKVKDAKAEPRVVEVTLATPMEIATYFGNLEMVQLLFHKGADPEEASHGYSAIQVAQACGHHHITRFLTMAMPLNCITI